MAKIKNWTYLGKTSQGHGSHYPYTWNNDLTKNDLFVGNLKKLSGEDLWGIEYVSNREYLIEEYKTKAEAMKFARNWMKKHPRG